MSNPAAEHRAEGPQTIQVAILTISDTRTEADDTSGDLIARLVEAAGHRIAARAIVSDDVAQIGSTLRDWSARPGLGAILATGGTGIAPRDQTFETVSALLTRTLPGYGELFRMLSYAEIGPAAMLSRALGGLIGEVVVLTMPGSKAGVELAMTRIILPELAHLVGQARKR